MNSKKNFPDKANAANQNQPELDDEGVLADGMIPDSRIVKLIDELEISGDDFDDEAESEIALKSIGLHHDR